MIVHMIVFFCSSEQNGFLKKGNVSLLPYVYRSSVHTTTSLSFFRLRQSFPKFTRGRTHFSHFVKKWDRACRQPPSNNLLAV